MTTANDVVRLRAETGAGVMDSKKALVESKGDFAKAKAILKERGLAKAAKKADRDAREGVVEAYVHGGGKIGVLVELSSETDFVARNPEFRDLAKAIAMQVAAMNPKKVHVDELTEDEVKQLVEEHGDKQKALETAVLLHQPYIKDPSKTIGDLVTEYAAKVGENVRVRRIVRFQLGDAA
ncbi:MAG TPA: translation elongation factor Ts [Candidatus Limnocylindria bacterium]|nr:translation elongation factor Ts [Candidatus Limnocylindria bacterium]